MYIKQIIIQGFKSYREQTVIEPFSPRHNVVVGRNGSGKSNFFAAIRFVLGDAYTQMGREERQALLHEGSGSAVMSAYVEIIFDNSDDRFPTGKPELILRRTIGLKKDEYSLDRKNATKTDVMNLLESAGFSRSNPYYIVPQGRVTTLTNMKDAERLNLLKEVAGTQVYEARRTESLKIMTDTENKRVKIDELLDYIRDRLAELEEEKEELREYQEKDKERRCLEYIIYSREQGEIASALETIEQQKQTGLDEADDNRDRFIEGEKVISQIDARTNELKQQLELLTLDKRQLEDERRDAARDKAQIELQVNQITQGQSSDRQAGRRYDTDLREVLALIQERERELGEVTPQYTQLRDQERDLQQRLTEAEGTRKRLYDKQGRQAQFRTKRQRDDWLRNDIQEINVALATRRAVTMQTTEEIAELEREVSTLEQELVGLQAQVDNRGPALSSIAEEVNGAKAKRDGLQDERKRLWREEARLDAVIGNAQRELEQAERFLSHMMDQNTSRGLAAVRRIKRQQNLEGVYGTLAELFQVRDEYKTAVEVTAGASLFHYVVDNDDTATRVLEQLQRDKAGRVTFMPLNRLRPKPANIPKANDAVEMITRLRFDEKYEKAFQQVFGKTIICPSLQVAAQYARSHGVSAITPEGDRSDKKGALTGGFYDPRHSRIDAVRNVLKWRDEFEKLQQQGQNIKRELERLDQEITRAVGELQIVEQRRSQLENSFGPLRQELRSKNNELQAKGDVLTAKQRSRDNIEAAVRDLGEQQSAYERELQSPFQATLTPQEESQLESLNSSVQELRRQVSETSGRRSEVEARKNTLEVELRENLRMRLDQLRTQEIEYGAPVSGNGRLQEREADLTRINSVLGDLEEKLSEVDQSMEQLNNQLSELQQSKSDKQREQEHLARAIERFQKRMEKSVAKKALLTDKAAECSRNIRDLGVLPDEAHTGKYQNLASDRAISRLHKINESLKKYSHVNKKAFEQYQNFTRQRENLTKRREELESSHQSIEELIEVLDQRKDEAIERTFRQVSREFATVFEKLVPAGRGRLIIQRRTDRVQPDDDDDEEERRESVENYTGVGISVSFNSKHDEQQRIQQLSGGQKSLCALALVFAIQRCDPAPFYLFDEIDANLDAQYRTAVAGMLREISDASVENGQSGQFIITTFRPELVHVAEKCYGVSFDAQRKTSSIDLVGTEDALKFVEGMSQGQR